MDIFTTEHDKLRKKYDTFDKAQYYLSSIKKEKIPINLVSWIESLKYFFFATSNKNGTNVNFKGSKSKHLLKVLDEKTLLFPDYEGNGIFHGVGDILSNENVGILCIDFVNDKRVKINGKAKIIEDKSILVKYFDIYETYDIQRLIEIKVEYLIPNCSNNISVVREEILNNQR